MSRDARPQPNNTPDPRWVEAITREVISRLERRGRTEHGNPEPNNAGASATSHRAASVDESVISVATLERLSGSPSQVFVGPNAVITPAAREEARRRRIEITPTVQLPEDQRPQSSDPNFWDVWTGEEEREINWQEIADDWTK